MEYDKDLLALWERACENFIVTLLQGVSPSLEALYKILRVSVTGEVAEKRGEQGKRAARSKIRLQDGFPNQDAHKPQQ